MIKMAKSTIMAAIFLSLKLHEKNFVNNILIVRSSLTFAFCFHHHTSANFFSLLFDECQQIIGGR